MTSARWMLAVALAAFAVAPAAAQDAAAPQPPAPAEVPAAPSAEPPPALLAPPGPHDPAQKQVPGRHSMDGKAAEVPAESKPHEPAAGEAKPDESSRYTFNRVQDGYVRLDNRTGQVSYCSKRTVGWTCQLAPEDRGVLENEIARVQEENASLKRELINRGVPLPGGMRADVPATRGERPSILPNDPNIERMKGFVEKVWRRLVEMITTLQKDVLKKS